MNHYNFDVLSYEIKGGTVITTSMGAKTMVTRTEKQFKKKIQEKHNFLTKINMNNVCIAGGFCRSMLLNQNVNDIDFFFHGLSYDKLSSRLYELMNEIIGIIKQDIPNAMFLVLYKDENHVVELLCFEINEKLKYDDVIKTLNEWISDESNSVSGVFSRYGINTIGKAVFGGYGIDSDEEEIKPTVTDSDDEEIKPTMTDSDDEEDNKPTITKKVSKMVENIKFHHKMQFILTQNDNIEKILNGFDLMASCVAYDGQHVYFNGRSHIAYKYMINIVEENKYSDLFDMRLIKYFDSGFSIVVKKMPTEINIKAGSNMIINKCVFSVSGKEGNIIIVNDKPAVNQSDSSNPTNHRDSSLYSDISGSSQKIKSVLENTKNFIKRYKDRKGGIFYKFVSDKFNKLIDIQFVDKIDNRYIDYVWATDKTVSFAPEE